MRKDEKNNRDDGGKEKGKEERKGITWRWQF